VKEFLSKRWKPLALMAIALATYGLSKFAPQLELERHLFETMKAIVENVKE
jgi:hypothetical protein